MVVFSKEFEEQFITQTCQSLSMHRDSCREHCLKDVPLYILSNLKYFAPICLIPALIRIRSMNKKNMRKTLEYYLQCSLTGAVVGYTTNVLICFFRFTKFSRYLFGHFGLYSFTYFPTIFGSFMTNFGSARVQQLFYTSIFQCNVETFFLMRQFFVSRLIADSKFLQTYLFMLCSAIILQGKHLYNIKGFWLLESNPKVAEIGNNEDTTCQLHPKDTCRGYLLDGMRKYFILGLTLDLVKALMSKVDDASANQSRLLGKIKNFRIRSMALLTTYIGIYRFAHCFLNRQYPNGSALNHFSSAFLAGFCYNFYPQSTLFSYAIVQTIRSVWTILKVENLNTNSSVLRNFLRIPFDRIAFPFALANCVHLVCLKPEYCSRLTSTVTNGVTNAYPNKIRDVIAELNQNVKKMASGQQSI